MLALISRFGFARSRRVSGFTASAILGLRFRAVLGGFAFGVRRRRRTALLLLSPRLSRNLQAPSRFVILPRNGSTSMCVSWRSVLLLDIFVLFVLSVHVLLDVQPAGPGFRLPARISSSSSVPLVPARNHIVGRELISKSALVLLLVLELFLYLLSSFVVR